MRRGIFRFVDKVDEIVAPEFDRQKVFKLQDLYVLVRLGVVLVDEKQYLASVDKLVFSLHLFLQ